MTVMTAVLATTPAPGAAVEVILVEAVTSGVTTEATVAIFELLFWRAIEPAFLGPPIGRPNRYSVPSWIIEARLHAEHDSSNCRL